MDKLTADFYVAYTGGQLQAFLHDDGNWYLYAPRPADADGTHTEGAQR